VPLAYSTDAGLYLCEFMLYYSLARAWLQRSKSESPPSPEPDPSIVFCHIEDGVSAERLQRNAKYIESLIKALAASRLANESKNVKGEDQWEEDPFA
jgi:hypothetical protein